MTSQCEVMANMMKKRPNATQVKILANLEGAAEDSGRGGIGDPHDRNLVKRRPRHPIGKNPRTKKRSLLLTNCCYSAVLYGCINFVVKWSRRSMLNRGMNDCDEWTSKIAD